jgi:hypothetical protein
MMGWTQLRFLTAFGIHGVDGEGRVMVHQRVTRKRLLGVLSQLIDNVKAGFIPPLKVYRTRGG